MKSTITAVLLGAGLLLASRLPAAAQVPQAPVLLSDSTPPPQGQTQCNDGIDNDGDGLIDIFAPGGNESLGDTGCATADDDSESVGIPAGTVLTAYTGPYTITANGTVIDSKDLTQQLTISANNVTIRKSRMRVASNAVVKTPINATNYGNVIEDSLIDGANGSDYCIVHNDGNTSQTSLTLTRVEIKGCGDMFSMGNSTVIADNYWHDNWNPPGAHGDGIEMNGGVHQWAHHNVVLGNYTTASISHGDYFSAVSDVLFEKNYVGGVPARLFAPGSGGAAGHPGLDDWRVSYNRFRCTVSVLPVFYPTLSQYGNVSQNDHLSWTGNVCAATGAIYDDPILGGGQPSGAGWLRACANGYDDDHDGKIDMADSGCSSSSDNLE